MVDSSNNGLAARTDQAMERGARADFGSAAPEPRASDQFQDLFTVMWKQRMLVLSVFAACLALGIAYLLVATPVYTTTSRLDLVLRVPDIGEATAAAERAEDYINTQCQLITSASVLGPVAARDDVRAMRMFAEAPDLLRALQGQLVVTPLRRSSLISVSLESPYPEEAAATVNAVVESYLEQQRQQRQTTTTEVLRIVRQEKQQREAELETRRQAMLKYKQDHATLSFVSERSNIAIERLAQLSAAATDAEIETVRAAASYQAGKAIFENPAHAGFLVESLATLVPGSAPQDNAIELVREQLSQLELRVASGERQLGDRNARLTESRELVTNLEEKLLELDRQAAASRLGVLEQAWLTAKEKQTAVESALREQREQAMELDSVAMQFAMLEADVQQAQRVIDNLDTRISELHLTQGAGALNVRVIEPARAGDPPTGPRKSVVLGAAGVLGLLLGGGGALLRHATDRRLRSSSQITSALRLPVVCGVPHIARARTMAQRGVVSLLQPASETAEAYRVVRTTIYLGHAREIKSLLITSPAKGDGKSTVASNLAITLAQAGERTLLLDADLRRQSQHIIFGIDNELGLSSLLRGEASIADVIQRTQCEGLDVMPAGPVPPNPSELLSGTAFAATLKQLSRLYDRIIIDAPPTVGLADPLILSATCDATLLVVRAGRSTREASEAMCASLTRVGAHLVGAVVNDVRGAEFSYRSGYYGDAGRLHSPGEPLLIPAKPTLTALGLTDSGGAVLANLLTSPAAEWGQAQWTVRAVPGADTTSVEFTLTTESGSVAWSSTANETPYHLFGNGPGGANPPPTSLAPGTYRLDVTPYRMRGGPHMPGNTAGATHQVTLTWRSVDHQAAPTMPASTVRAKHQSASKIASRTIESRPRGSDADEAPLSLVARGGA